MAGVVGLDLSLTATGICTAGGAGVFKPRSTGMERLHAIASFVAARVSDGDVVVIEGYSFGSKGNAMFNLGELGGVVRLDLYKSGISFVDVPPSVLKKFATGNGNANKAAMVLAAGKAGYDGPGDDNAVDAWWLRNLGIYAAGGNVPIAPGVNDTQHRADAAAKIDWPAL